MVVQTANNSDHGGDDEDEEEVASRTTKRRYQRTWWHDDGHGLDEIEQSIFELEPTDTVLSMSLSVDESCLACLVEDATTGQRQVRLHHIESNRQVSLDMGRRIVGVEWGGASSALGGGIHALYFVETDEQGRPDRVLRSHVHSTVLHMIDEPQLLIRSYDPSEMVVAQRTKGCEFISIQIMTKTSNEIYLSSAGQSSLQLVMQRQPNVQYHLDVGEHGDIVMLLSDQGRDYELLEASTKSLPLDPEETLRKVRTASPEKQAVITDMDLFRNYLVLYETSTTTGYPQIRIQDRESRNSSHSTTIPLEPKVVQVCPTGNVFFGATSLRLIIENPCTPPTTYELDFSSLDLKPVNGSTSLESSRNVKQERVFVPSSDGTSIPMSLFYQGDGGDAAMKSGEEVREEASPWWSFLGSTGGETSKKQESRPVLLMGYGSYGEAVNFGYDPALIPLLEQGYVLAFGHSRGGGELGRTWYHAGRLHAKPNAINDFLACAEHLHNRFQSKVSVRGFSAAGIVLGAAVNQRPDLFESLVLTNPFLDLYSTMVNPSLYLTAHEWDEFGNPQDDEGIDRLIRSYCPIRNVASNTDSYPRCLLIGTLDDENVPWWKPTIFAKKVRDGMSDKDNVLLHIEERGGHHLGPKRLEVSALEVAFLLNGEKRAERDAQKV
jgi:oligopeptidase B